MQGCASRRRKEFLPLDLFQQVLGRFEIDPQDAAFAQILTLAGWPFLSSAQVRIVSWSMVDVAWLTSGLLPLAFALWQGVGDDVVAYPGFHKVVTIAVTITYCLPSTS